MFVDGVPSKPIKAMEFDEKISSAATKEPSSLCR